MQCSFCRRATPEPVIAPCPCGLPTHDSCLRARAPEPHRCALCGRAYAPRSRLAGCLRRARRPAVLGVFVAAQLAAFAYSWVTLGLALSVVVHVAVHAAVLLFAPLGGRAFRAGSRLRVRQNVLVVRAFVDRLARDETSFGDVV